jgi:hypothetical protein
VVAVGIMLGGLAVWKKAAGVEAAHPENAVYVGDLDEMSTRVGVNLMPADVANPPLTLDDFRRSSIYALDTLWFYGRRASLRQPPAVSAEIAAAWRHAVRTYPVVYLHGRWKLFTRQIGWSGPPAIAWFPADIGAAITPHPRFPSAAADASRYLTWFTAGSWQTGGWVHRLWWWWLLSWVAVLWAAALRRRRQLGRYDVHLMLALAISAHVLMLFFVAPHLQYRFVEAAVVLAQISLVIAVATWWRVRRRVSHPAGVQVGGHGDGVEQPGPRAGDLPA